MPAKIDLNKFLHYYYDLTTDDTEKNGMRLVESAQKDINDSFRDLPALVWGGLDTTGEVNPNLLKIRYLRYHEYLGNRYREIKTYEPNIFYPNQDWDKIKKDPKKSICIIKGDFKAIRLSKIMPTISINDSIDNVIRKDVLLSGLYDFNWRGRVVNIYLNDKENLNIKFIDSLCIVTDYMTRQGADIRFRYLTQDFHKLIKISPELIFKQKEYIPLSAFLWLTDFNSKFAYIRTGKSGGKFVEIETANILNKNMMDKLKENIIIELPFFIRKNGHPAIKYRKQRLFRMWLGWAGKNEVEDITYHATKIKQMYKEDGRYFYSVNKGINNRNEHNK